MAAGSMNDSMFVQESSQTAAFGTALRMGWNCRFKDRVRVPAERGTDQKGLDDS